MSADDAVAAVGCWYAARPRRAENEQRERDLADDLADDPVVAPVVARLAAAVDRDEVAEVERAAARAQLRAAVLELRAAVPGPELSEVRLAALAGVTRPTLRDWLGK